MESIRRVVLIGLSGVGKSTVGGLLAERLGWSLIDTDAALVAEAGEAVPEIFRARGEEAFRAMEREVLARALVEDRIVVATGGGAVVAEDAWSEELLGRKGTLVVALDAEPGTSLHRLRAQLMQEGGAAERPLLTGGDPLERLAEMKAQRAAAYDRATVTLPVDHSSPNLVVDDLVQMVRGSVGAPDITLETPSGTSSILVAPGLFRDLGRLVRQRWRSAHRVWIVSDENVGAIFGDRAGESLEAEGFAVHHLLLPPGERSKSVAGVSAVWDWMLGTGVERSDVAIALGGGVVGDLAGFAAATVLRGIDLVQVPTTLQAMVDASVGGKTGINHPGGKNLIGAFHQPSLVVIDPTLLRTVPPRELRSGWAEVVKHAVIQRSTPGGERADLLPFLERNASALRMLQEPATSYAIRRNVALKAAVVAADEQEQGIRSFLNFGHTLGHGIEAADYALLHGEAVALGMRAAARIGRSVGTCDSGWVARIDDALDRFDLPRAAPVEPSRVLEKVRSDKKRAAGRLRWVLPLGGGGVTIRDDVPEAVVAEALRAVIERGR